MEKATILYPCPWSYRIIGTDQRAIEEAIAQLLPSERYTLEVSQKSAKSTYTSLRLSITVENEEERLSLFEKFKELPTVKMVL